MVYKKLTIFTIIVSIIAAITCNFVFATGNDLTSDKIYDTTLKVLVFIQKYTWPVITLVFVYALYQFYVAGSEFLEHKIIGQRLIIGVAVFMVLIQILPLFYAFVLVNQT